MKIKLFLLGTIIAGVLLNCSASAEYKENALDLNVDYIKVIIEGHADFFFKGSYTKR